MILTVTLNPAVDHTIGLDESLESGHVHRTDRRSFDPGGKGINVSLYLNELGIDTVAAGLVGGRVGNYIEHSLSEEGLETAFVEIEGVTRLNTTILSDDGEYKINQSGPPVAVEYVSRLIDDIRTHHPETVVIAGSLPPGLGSGVVDYIASAGNWRTVVDAGGDVLTRLSRRYAMCAPNRTELAAATGCDVDSLEQCFEAAAQLRRDGFERVLASIGTDGAILVGPRGNFHATACEVESVDTVGAGDALLAGVLAGLDEGQSDGDVLARGVAIASRAVETTGTVVPSLDGLSSEIDEIDVTLHEDRSPGTTWSSESDARERANERPQTGQPTAERPGSDGEY